MVFSKAFPKHIEGSSYPKWEEVSLTNEEEARLEADARQENIRIMKECIDDGKALLEEKGFRGFKEDIIKVAIPLFEKRASHSVYWKERECKEKFDELSK